MGRPVAGGAARPAVPLGRTLAWSTAEGDDLELLETLQANILTAHVRTHLSVLLLEFTDADDGRAFLRALAAPAGRPGDLPFMKSARDHLVEKGRWRNPVQGVAESPPYVGVGLTARGYRALGVLSGAPADPSFVAGMQAPRTQAVLRDPPAAGWDPPFSAPGVEGVEGVDGGGDLHAAVFVGAQLPELVEAARARIEALRPASVRVRGELTGASWRNRYGQPAEHFGFADGLSGPVFLDEELAELAAAGQSSRWQPAAALDRVLVPDPAAPDPRVHHGSYLVLRKLEQDVEAFRAGVAALAAELGLDGADGSDGSDAADRAGALVIGRTPDGTPLLPAPAPSPNDFTFADDPRGRWCPLPAHLRKLNPRGSSWKPEQERQAVLVRRGQTYGERPDASPTDPHPRPRTAVGILFVGLAADLGGQFEFLQGSWANSRDEPAGLRPAGVLVTVPDQGQDQLIGQGDADRLVLPDGPGGPVNRSVPALPAAVTMRGGEYFFLPSLAFLRELPTTG